MKMFTKKPRMVPTTIVTGYDHIVVRYEGIGAGMLPKSLKEQCTNIRGKGIVPAG
jgi:hypothetical protein